MDIAKLLIELAPKAPALFLQGVKFVHDVKAAVEEAPHLLSESTQADLDEIHNSALLAVDNLDAKLAAAEKK